MKESVDIARRLLRTALAMCGLISPALFLLVLRPVLDHRASVCNTPSIVARAVVALMFLIAVVLLLAGIEHAGLRLMLSAVALNVAMILWFVAASRFRVSPEIMGWAYQDVLAVLLVGSLRYSPARGDGAA